MNYLLLFSVPLVTTMARLIMKKYKNDTVKIPCASNIYVILTCFVAMAYFAIMAKGNVVPNVPTFIYAVFLAAFAFCCNIFQLLAVTKIRIAVIAVFMNAGSIIIPYLYEMLFLKTPISYLKTISVILLLIVVAIPFILEKEKVKGSFMGYVYCILLFIESGLVTVLCQLYLQNPNALDNNVFCFWGNAIMLPFVLITALKTSGIKKLAADSKKLHPKTYILAVGGIICSNLSTLLSLVVLEYVSITVYTIINVSGNLIFTALLALVFFREKISKSMLISIIISIIAIILNTL